MTAETISVPFDVYRYQPGKDATARYQRYTLDLVPHTPVLTALLQIRSENDPSLGLRYSCRSAICGSCAMQINSKSRLACETQVGPEVARHGRIVVEPMRNQPVIRDLIVDQTRFWREYSKVEPHLKLDPSIPMPAGKPTSMSPAQVERFKETPRCIACAACFSACPAAEADAEFPGPMALAKLYRFAVDPRDTATGSGSHASSRTASGSASAAIFAPRPARRTSDRPSGSGTSRRWRSRSRAPRNWGPGTPSGSRRT